MYLINDKVKVRGEKRLTWIVIRVFFVERGVVYWRFYGVRGILIEFCGLCRIYMVRLWRKGVLNWGVLGEKV